VEGEESAEIDPNRCIGCGVCVSSCPREAILFEPREDAVVPPGDWEETLERIEVELGLASGIGVWPYIDLICGVSQRKR